MTTFGSVCSGIEAASAAWHPLGWTAAWLAEIEPFPSAVLRHHYPDVPNLGDMTTIAHKIGQGTVAAPDVLVGGTPCQAFSIAGLRRSLDDTRGQLTLSFVELANVIDAVRSVRGQPECIAVWENVPGVLNTADNAFGCLLAGLAGEDEPVVPPGKKWANAGAVCGPQRTVAWRVLDAQYFGLAQRRRRVFVIASARTDFDPVEVLLIEQGLQRHTAPSRETPKNLAGTLASRTTGGSFPGTDEACDGYLQPVAYGGNHTPGPINTTACLNTNRGCHNPGDFEAGTLLLQPVVSTLDASFGRLQGCSGQDANHGHSHLVPCGPYAIQAGALRTNPASGPDGVGVQETIAYTLEARAEVQAVAFSCKDHGADATTELAPTLRAMGYAASHANAGGQLAVCITGDVTHTLKADGFDASEDGTGRGQPIVAHRLAVRRLTPRECERLQGFPDDYTLIPWRGKCSPDGPRYKALGNSMAVPVMAWIGDRIDQYNRGSYDT